MIQRELPFEKSFMVTEYYDGLQLNVIDYYLLHVSYNTFWIRKNEYLLFIIDNQRE